MLLRMLHSLAHLSARPCLPPQLTRVLTRACVHASFFSSPPPACLSCPVCLFPIRLQKTLRSFAKTSREKRKRREATSMTPGNWKWKDIVCPATRTPSERTCSEETKKNVIYDPCLGTFQLMFGIKLLEIAHNCPFKFWCFTLVTFCFSKTK